MDGEDAPPVQALARAQDRFNLDVANAVAPFSSPVSWTPMPLLSSWVVYGATSNAPAYYQEANGRVWLKGRIKSGSLNANLFTVPMPAPAYTWRLVCTTNTGAGIVTVLTNGTVQLASGGTTDVSLDSLSYVP